VYICKTDSLGIRDFIQSIEQKEGKARAVMESTGSYWCGPYDELGKKVEQMLFPLANPLKTRAHS
jgi:transposase